MIRINGISPNAMNGTQVRLAIVSNGPQANGDSIALQYIKSDGALGTAVEGRFSREALLELHLQLGVWLLESRP